MEDHELRNKKTSFLTFAGTPLIKQESVKPKHEPKRCCPCWFRSKPPVRKDPSQYNNFENTSRPSISVLPPQSYLSQNNSTKKTTPRKRACHLSIKEHMKNPSDVFTRRDEGNT
jgi:hypothetical protein